MRALISVSDKTGVVEVASALSKRNIEIISTGGTANALKQAGVPVTAVSDITDMPEMLDGRVKTLHPSIHGGLLARLERDEHRQQLERAGIEPISILISNLYPFEQTATRPNTSAADVVENIDIGGPAMVRAAAKNFDHVYVITNPGDYAELLEAMDAAEDDRTAFRKRMAAKAFGHVSTYDGIVAQWLRGENMVFPDELTIPLRLRDRTRYGENPHQQGAVYQRLSAHGESTGLLDAQSLVGGPLSFNNYLDADAAWQAAQGFDEPTVAIVKHTVPCGLAVRTELSAAWRAAIAGDPVSAFGGIVSLNGAVDLATASLMRKIKLDIIIAPGYDDDALEVLQKKKGTRILRLQNRAHDGATDGNLDLRPIAGGMLVQTPNTEVDDASAWTVVTRYSPTDDQMADLSFAWRTARMVKSNAIVFAKNQAIVGVGAGQPNRLESVAIAARKAGDNAHGASMASDAFFPFADGIQTAIDAGIAAVIQPGGSMRDDEVIAAANSASIPMVFTGTRHFRH